MQRITHSGTVQMLLCSIIPGAALPQELGRGGVMHSHLFEIIVFTVLTPSPPPFHASTPPPPPSNSVRRPCLIRPANSQSLVQLKKSQSLAQFKNSSLNTYQFIIELRIQKRTKREKKNGHSKEISKRKDQQ